MHAEFFGGPYDGMKLEPDDINRYAQIATPFVFMPALDKWGKEPAPPTLDLNTGTWYTYRRERTESGVSFRYEQQVKP